MPTLELDDQEFQLVVNAVAMQHPLVAKMMRQAQEQQNASSLDAQRNTAPGAQGRTGGNSQHGPGAATADPTDFIPASRAVNPAKG
jgi:hypothetical protein